MANLRDLEQGLKRLGERVVEAAAAVQTKVAANITSDVAVETPVDTSRAQSNWQLDEHKEGGRFFFDPPVSDVRHGNQRGPAFVKVVRDARRERERLDRTRALVKGNRVLPVYILNLTPYLDNLNRGSSPQAPAGFIEQTATRTFRRQKRDFDRFIVDELRRNGG